MLNKKILVFVIFFILVISFFVSISALKITTTDQADLPKWNIGNYWKYNMEFIYEDSTIKLDSDNFQITAKVVSIENEKYILELEETDVRGDIEWNGVVKIGQFYAVLSGFAYIDIDTLGIKAFNFHVEGDVRAMGAHITTFDLLMTDTFDSFDFLDFPISTDENTWQANTNYFIQVDVTTGLGIDYHNTTSGNFLDEITLKGKETINGYESYRISGSEGIISDLWYSPAAGYLVKVKEAVDWGTVIGTFNLDIIKTNFNEGNHPPETPEKPSGPANGDTNSECSFSSVTTDQDNDQIYYLFNWGDKTNSGWLGPFNSGSECSASHSWGDQGVYHISVKAKDEEDLESAWSESLPVTIGNGEKPIVTFTMCRIKEIGDIEGLGHGEADWSYSISFKDDEWSDVYNNNYSTNNDDHEEEVEYKFDVHQKTPELKIKVWDRDPYIPLLDDHDLADVSSYKGGGKDNDISDRRGAIAFFKYDVVNNEIVKVDEIKKSSGCYYTSGTLDNEGDSNSQNDATVWFKIIDTYEKPSVQISYNGIQSTEHSIKFYVSISGGAAEYSWQWDFGDGETSTEKNPTHIYKNPGEYDVTLTVTDSLGEKGIDKVENLIIEPNESPDKPEKPIGPTNIQKNARYSYISSTEDNEKDDVFYLFDWGDGTDSGWLGSYESGQECKTSHSWSGRGTYDIKVKSKDEFGAESQWSDPLSVSLSRHRIPTTILYLIEKLFPNLFKFFNIL